MTKDDRIAALEAQNTQLDDILTHWQERAKELFPMLHQFEEVFEHITEYRTRIAALEAERDALAAAVIATPMPSIIENTQPFAPVPADSLLKLEWRAGRVYEWWATREGDVEFASRILAARDARMKREGALEALKELRESAIESIKIVLFESSGRHDGAARDSYCEGVQDVIVDLDAAIAALDAEEAKP